MNKIALSAAALAIMAVGAHADYTIDIPAGTASDSSAANAMIPVQSYSDDVTTTDLSIASKTIKLSVTWGSVAKYKANAGILLPMNKLWTPVDFSAATAIWFDYKTSGKVAGVEFKPNSDLYMGAASNNGVMLTAALGAAASVKTAKVALPGGLEFLEWMGTDFPDEVNQSWDNVKAEVKILQFSPMPINGKWGTPAEGISEAGAATLEISNIKILGDITVDDGGNVNWISTMGTGCSGTKVFQLSAFGSGTPNQNTMEGYWFSFTDQNAEGKASGVSTIVEVDGAQDGIVYLSGNDYPVDLAGVTVKLDKGNVTTNPYGGWADLGTGFTRTQRL